MLLHWPKKAALFVGFSPLIGRRCIEIMWQWREDAPICELRWKKHVRVTFRAPISVQFHKTHFTFRFGFGWRRKAHIIRYPGMPVYPFRSARR